MKNKLSDLNNHLFEQLERLNDENLSGDKLGEEILRSRAVTSVAQQIIANGNLVLDAAKFTEEYGIGMKAGERKMPALLRESFLDE